MIFTQLPLDGAYLIEPEIFQDDRGSFYRYYCENEFKQIGHSGHWVQLNHSKTRNQGTIRGMHFQLPPYAEIKMVKCIAGRILDVIIDIRNSSPTFLQWTGIELSATNNRMLYIPQGFAHGFQTLTDDCELIYHHSAFYVKGSESGIRWDDPLISITWPLPPSNLSERDKQHAYLSNQFTDIK
ncbi:MAG: dTDP-4-dehydrorhamnose 3,5-epimerase [Saprospiraceae bacterium]|nr:dTDP-4-dehydrorhamnose 3,5-epimerase [Saprospiraceae bacterium]